MANREACELYIEQEIEAGLEEGKTPYSIGQELSGWIAKLFETRIPPDTIKNRAARLKKKIDSNESKKSKTPEITPKIIEQRKPQGGGKRKGAGVHQYYQKMFIQNLFMTPTFDLKLK